MHHALIWRNFHIRDATAVIISWLIKVYSEPISAVFVEVLGFNLVDVGVRLIGEAERLRADAKSEVNRCQKTVYRSAIH